MYQDGEFSKCNKKWKFTSISHPPAWSKGIDENKSGNKKMQPDFQITTQISFQASHLAAIFSSWSLATILLAAHILPGTGCPSRQMSCKSESESGSVVSFQFQFFLSQRLKNPMPLAMAPPRYLVNDGGRLVSEMLPRFNSGTRRSCPTAGEGRG